MPDVGRVLFVFFGIGILLFVGLGAFAGQYDDSVRGAGTETAIVNESVTVTNGATLTLAESDRDVIYNETVTVRNLSAAGNPVVPAAGNYTWNDANGTLAINATSTFEDGNTAGVDYTFWVPTAEQEYVRDLGIRPFGVLDGFLPLFALLLVAGALLWARGHL